MSTTEILKMERLGFRLYIKETFGVTIDKEQDEKYTEYLKRNTIKELVEYIHLNFGGQK